jgi:hypothetical protein
MCIQYNNSNICKYNNIVGRASVVDKCLFFVIFRSYMWPAKASVLRRTFRTFQSVKTETGEQTEFNT